MTPKGSTKKAAPRGLTHTQHKYLEQHQLLLDHCEVVSQAYADALAVQRALTIWADDAGKKAARALAAVHKARDALFAHNDKLAKALRGCRAPSAAIELWTASMARTVAAIDKALAYCEQSSKRIDEMERNAKLARRKT